MKPHSARSTTSYLIDIVLLLALCLLFFWRDLMPAGADALSFARGDFGDQFYAFAHYEASRLQAGQLPLWNPFAFAGHPFLADIQAAIYYPPSLLTMLLTAGASQLPYQALQLEAIAHFFLVAIFTYLFVRRLTASRIGGLTAAVVFTFSGYLTSYPPLQLAILEVQTWLPLILLCLDVAATRMNEGNSRRAVGWTAAAGLVLGLSTLAGHPQASLLVLYGTAAFMIYRLFAPYSADRTGRPIARRAGLVLLFLGIGLAIAAAQILPSLEFMRLSTRANASFDEMGAGFLPFDLIQLILPAVGVPFPALYVGILPLGLAAAAVVRHLVLRRRDDRSPGLLRQDPTALSVAFWTGIGFLALLLSFGKNLPLYQIFYLAAPGWRLFRHQERVIVWSVLALAVLAGYGCAWLASLRSTSPSQPAEEDARLKRGLARGFGFAALAALALAAVFFVGYQAGRDPLWGFTTATIFLASMLALAALAVRSGRPALLLGVIVLDLFAINPGNHSGPFVTSPFPPNPILEAVQADQEPFRIANLNALPGNYGVPYRLEEIGGASPLQLASLDALMQRVAPARAWELLNVKYVLSDRETLDAPSEQIATGQNDDGAIYLYKLANPTPRAWLAGHIIVEPDADRLWERLADPTFDPQREVLLAQPPDLPASDGTTDCRGETSWIERSPEHLSLDVRTEQPCVLVLSELTYPGWRATVDGAEASLLRANGLLRAIALPVGSHQVEMDFRPGIVTWGLAISLGAVVLALALMLWSGRAETRSRQTSEV